MKFVPIKLKVKNFMSYESLEFDFTKHSGLNLITGVNKDVPNTTNGSGKSTITSSLAFALYGRSLSNLSNSSLVNMMHPTDECECSAEFLIGEKRYQTTWRIVKGNYIQCQIIEDGKDITPPGVAEARKLIETNILGMNFKNSFLQTVILTKEHCPSFFTLPAAQKRTFIETLFDLSVFGKMNELVRRGALDISKEILLLQQEEMSTKKNLKQLEEKESKFLEESKNELDEIRGKIQPLIESLCKTLGIESVSQVAERRDQMEKLRESLIEQEKELNSKQLSIVRLNSEIDVEIRNKTAFVKKYESILDCVCESCKTIIEDRFGLDAAHETIESKDAQKSQAKLEETAIKESIITIRSKLEKIRSKIEEAGKISNDIRILKSKIENANKKVSPYAEMIESGRISLQDTEKRREKKHALEMYHGILQHMTSEDGIKKTILENLVTILNSQVEFYLMQLGANYSCKFKSDFECTFTASGKDREFASFSAGEKARIDLATLFAFKDLLTDQTVMGSSIMIMDEFFDSALDDHSIAALLRILKDASSKYGQTIYIISHREMVKNEIFSSNWIDNTIVVEKQNGISRIVKDRQGGIV